MRQTEIEFVALQTFCGLKERHVEETGRSEPKRACRPAGADARFLALAADVAAQGTGSGDAAVSPLAAPAWSHRAAMAHSPRACVARGGRGHGAGAHRV